MDREKCVECGRSLRNYKQGAKRIHRKCWLNLRDKEDRRFDFLFCKDKKKELMKKTMTFEPITDIAGNVVYKNEDEIMAQIDKIADELETTSSLSSSPHSPPPSPSVLTRS